ncbi:hypothetical protein [Filimonas effusa]|uniref:Lipoprotein n=1 Tax=Filimonas effusa TaxID=2508721 RepID=A0A4Q1D5W1_9BACT|nr:hypothetical protein [Filimonas effusa]RXK83920.1 hypothetical protein ESB13_17785 [Filimonas effusa]
MTMRKLPFLLAVICTISACKCNSNNEAVKEEEAVVLDSAQTALNIIAEDSATVFDDATRQWLGQSLKQPAVNWDRFKLISFWAEDSMQKADAALPRDFYNRFASVLKWSPDSSYILDIGSYGAVVVKDRTGKDVVEAGEPDSEVSIIYPKEHKKARILFGGPSSLQVLNASWADSSQVAMLALQDTSRTGRPDTLLWLIDVKEHFFRKYKWQ